MRTKIIYSCFAVLLSLLLQGCAYYSFGYTEKQSLIKYQQPAQKYDVTYSVSYFTPRTDIFAISDQGGIQEKIQKNLVDSRLFGRVSYVPFKDRSPYHYHFDVIYNAPTVDTSASVGVTAGLTLLLIPTWETATIDVSARVYHNQDMVHSVSTPEINRCFVWLPLLPVGLVWNHWLSWSYVENKCIRFVVNDLTQFHYNQFIVPPGK